MKKTLLFAWIFLSGMCFIACSSDDDNNNKSPVEERVHDLDIFTDRLITVDELGNLENVNIGVALNSKVAPEVFSIEVKDLAEAKALFMELVDGFTDISTSGDDITVVLYDAEGKEQGKVFFKKGDGAELATMTYEGFTVQGITTLRYLDQWPVVLNAPTSRYKLYDIVTVPSDREGNPRGVCIREYSNGTNGMIICPTSYECGYQDWRANSSLETLKAMAGQVKKLGVDKVSARLKQANLYSDLGKYYWSNTTKFYFFDKGHWKVRLSDGDDKYVSSWEVALSNNNANNAYTYYFNGNGKCW